MIRVHKRIDPPDILRRGEPLTARDERSFDDRPDLYLSGVIKFAFDKGVYGATQVKDALKKDQHGKCCFCEGLFDAHVAGDVEHFRPKGAVKKGRVKQYPGYFWLAYEWQNLYYCCPDCNQYRKRDQFPLDDEKTRARSHHDSIQAESPLLIDPGDQDPEMHIRFDHDWPVGLTDQGLETIRVLKLDREALNSKRRKHLGNIKRLRVALFELEALADSGDVIAELQAALDAETSPMNEFSAASRDFIEGWSRPAELPEPQPNTKGRAA